MMLKTTSYYRSRVKRDRPEIQDERVERISRDALDPKQQGNGWWQLWGPVPEAEGRMPQVITEEHGETAVNALLFDRRFAKKKTRTG
jgi:hypothetical protein